MFMRNCRLLAVSLAAVWAGAVVCRPEPDVQAAEVEGPVFEGVAEDAGTGQPAKGLTVVVERRVAGKPAGELKLEGDATGRFRFELPRDWADPADAHFAVRVNAPPGFVAFPYRGQRGGVFYSADEGVTLDELRREQTVGVPPYFGRVRLFPTRQVKGRVVDPLGKPVEGVEVLVCSVHLKNEVFPPQRVVRRAKTDADGRFAAEVANPGPAVLYLMPERFAPKVVKLTDPEGDLGAYKLEAGVEITGKLRDVKNQILPGRWVRLGEPVREPEPDLELWNVGFGSLARWCRTGPTGNFLTGPLAPGEYEATAHEPGEDPVAGRPRVGEPLNAWFPPQKVTVPANGTPEWVVLQAVPHVNVEIKVVDVDGKPRDGAACPATFTLDGKIYASQLRGQANDVVKGHQVLRVPYGTSRLQAYVYPRDDVDTSALCDYRPGKDAAERHGYYVFLNNLDGDRTLEYVWTQGAVASLRVSTEDGSALPKDTQVTPWQREKEGVIGRLAAPMGSGVYRLGTIRADAPLTIEVKAAGYKPMSRDVKLPAGTPQRLEVVLEKEPEKDEGS